MYNIDQNKLNHSPRAVRYWECCLAVFYENISTFEKDINSSDANNSKVNINKIIENADNSSSYLDTAFSYYKAANKNHISSYEFEDLNIDFFFTRTVKPKRNRNKPTSIIKQQFHINSRDVILRPKIAVANTKVLEANIKRSLRGTPNLDSNRFDDLYKIFRQAKEEKANILLFPECFIPIEFLDRVAWYSVKEQKMIVTGLEHVTKNGVSFNFLVTILPFEINGVKDAVIVYRLKNHYSHAEKLLIETNHYIVPHPIQYVYDLFIWKGLYFSPYYCFELADVKHRSIFKSQIDLLIACEWNPDTNYFSNIVESISRDIHVYVAQVNTSQFGDTRITQPAKTHLKDILKLKGGDNDTILVGEIDLKLLREFQRELYITTKDDRTFKPLPPDYSLENTLKRTNNQPIF